MIKTDIIIIGAGPVGLFTVFEAGLIKLKCHLIDALPIPGGQCAEIYPKKPIYDIPGYPSILAGDLVDNLMEQIKPFKPGFTLGETAANIEKTEDNQFIVTTKQGTKHQAPVVAIAGGLGVFIPRKPPIFNLKDFEEKGVNYIVKDPEVFKNKKLVISGGGDSALDWALFFANEYASEVTLVHRSQSFRAHLDSVQKAMTMAENGKINLLLDSEVIELNGNGSLDSVVIRNKSKEKATIHTDFWLPLFGLSPKLGPIANWGLEIKKNAIVVDNATDYSTNIEGIYAIGDVNTYPGKLKLILCGFHEATIMVQSAFKKIHPNKNNVLKYTTVSGVTGFE
ncbi:MAG: ferredoxin--NADP(+) reductase [Flavobacteriales bacterium]|nr:ferredoxin--NADP(+) reductase [Flavobacteriales bacterium]MBG14805.1 ferredoxin--NADP(+) reductase [Crocinitomicaceae bacterium]|tara:strand:- start:529 stop:1542 length:1014 start_codon:yes stop_codon:yes gene_type:complete